MLCTVIVDNTCSRPNLRSEHGLSLHIQSGDRALIFDAGKSNLVIENLKKLGLDGQIIEWILLSHGHYDHITGVPGLLRMFPNAKLHFHPRMLEPKWILDAPGQWRYGGILQSFSRLSPQMIPSYTESMELILGVWSSGSIMGDDATTFVKGKFFRNPRGNLIPDAFPDEQVLVVRGANGISIVSGCCHAGVEKTIQKVRALFPKERFDAFIGGLHLDGASRATLSEITQKMIDYGFKRLMPLHCSGVALVAYLAEEYPQLLVRGGIGERIEL